VLLNAISVGQAQGRYLFPALGILAALGGLGACGALSRRGGWWLAATFALLLFAGNVAALAGVLRPAYSPTESGRLTRLRTTGGTLLIQHAPGEPGSGLLADRKGQWLLAAPAEEALAVDLVAQFTRRGQQSLLQAALAGERVADPADLAGVAAVDSDGPGASAASRVQPLTMTVAGRRRRALLVHPTSRVLLDPVPVPSGAHVEVRLGIDERAWDKGGDGVLFRLLARTSRGGEHLLLERYLDPKARHADRRWLEEAADVGSLAGRRVSFVLETLPGPDGDTSYDWSAWAGLDLVVPQQDMAVTLCDTDQGRRLDPAAMELRLPPGGNITLRLPEPPGARAGVRMQLLPATTQVIDGAAVP
jgi:hypothetical protein